MADDSGQHWIDWHAPYDEPGSALHRRLLIVQARIAAWLAQRDEGPLRVVSMCAGQGRDLIGVLAEHSSASRVTARLVELDPRNAEVAREAAASAGLAGVEVMCADAGSTDPYFGAVPADLVLACGVFGNISDVDVKNTIDALPQLCSSDATVIWTRSRRKPDLTPTIRSWFAETGFVEVAFDAPVDALFTVGVHGFVGDPVPLQEGVRLFRFTS